jgi:heme iron utilization protein
VNIPPHAPLHLLHRVPEGTLATQSRDPRGYPYPTALPFAPTADHVPMILISHLAEHTRNLHADPHAGFLVAHTAEGSVLEGQRLTMLGTFKPAPAGTHAALARRYLRYHPDAERYLALGDFTFWVMTLERMRFIGGFGAMGWLDANSLDPLDPLGSEEESSINALFDDCPDRPANLKLLGTDRYGCDFEQSNQRNRFTFDSAKNSVAELKEAVVDFIDRHK